MSLVNTKSKCGWCAINEQHCYGRTEYCNCDCVKTTTQCDHTRLAIPMFSAKCLDHPGCKFITADCGNCGKMVQWHDNQEHDEQYFEYGDKN